MKERLKTLEGNVGDLMGQDYVLDDQYLQILKKWNQKEMIYEKKIDEIKE